LRAVNAVAQPRYPLATIQFFLTVFLSAFLLFWTQLILGKFLLPGFGGTPAVWTACMLFFQVLLLAGYLYAHLLSTRLRGWAQALTHGTILVRSPSCAGCGRGPTTTATRSTSSESKVKRAILRIIVAA